MKQKGDGSGLQGTFEGGPPMLKKTKMGIVC